MKKKQFFIYFTMLLSAAFGTWSCDDDDNDWGDVDGGVPAVALTSEHIMTEAGRSIKLAGTITDNDGIATINLLCHELNLNKTIDIIDIYGEPLKSYDLDFAWKIESNQTGDSFTVKITTTDVGGRTDTKDVLVTMDGDFTAPVFTAAPDKEITVLIKAQTMFNLKFTVTDNRAIDYVTVDVAGVEGFPLRIEGNGRSEVGFSQKLPLPGEAGTYNVAITAYDKAAQEGEVRSTSITSTVKVSELPDFEKMYLADVATTAELNSDVFGVPMLVEHVGEYRYQARYYNEKAGTEICFIPQKTDFSPICFGPDPDNNGLLGDDPETSGRIRLDEGGVYYLIDFNISTGEYTLSTYSIDEAIDPVMHLHFGENDLNTWWETNNMDDIWWQEFYFGPAGGPGDVTRFTQDSKNPHIYYVEDWELDEGEKSFIIHNWHSHGWWNFTTWRVDNSAEPEKFMYYGNLHPATPHYESNADYFEYRYGNDPTFDLSKWGDEAYRKNYVPDNWCKPVIPSAGKYRFVFDAHLERAKLLKN